MSWEDSMVVIDESVLRHAHITKTTIKNLKTTNNDGRGSCLQLQFAIDYLSIAYLFTPSSPLKQGSGCLRRAQIWIFDFEKDAAKVWISFRILNQQIFKYSMQYTEKCSCILSGKVIILTSTWLTGIHGHIDNFEYLLISAFYLD